MGAESSRYYDTEKISRAQRVVPPLPLRQLQDSTDNFSKERVLGQGGFGVVYKGVLQNGQVIAIKKFRTFLEGNSEEQLKKELTHLMGLEHKNIVRLVGYCNNAEKILVDHEGTLRFAEQQEMLLCLEFLPGGSLDKHISDACHGLDWQMRCKIIMGICHGLHYLHENRIIHLDLKPANILLDNDMVPKITDFGLSRVIGPEQTRIYTSKCVGTRGYMAPEYLEKGIISIKSDVFSVGVVIIEIIVGHRNYPDGTEMSMQNFVEHVLQNWRNRLEKLRCASLEKDCQQIKVCIEIGLRCVHTDAAKRPTTREIIECLRTNFHVSNKEETPAYQGKERRKKPDGFYTGKKIRDMKPIQDKMVASVPMANFHMAPTNSITPFSISMQQPNQHCQVPKEAPVVDNETQHLLEENNRLLNQIAANIETFKTEQNTDLLLCTSDNIKTILRRMSETPGIMGQMPALPVLIKEDQLNSVVQLNRTVGAHTLLGYSQLCWLTGRAIQIGQSRAGTERW